MLVMYIVGLLCRLTSLLVPFRHVSLLLPLAAASVAKENLGIVVKNRYTFVDYSPHTKMALKKPTQTTLNMYVRLSYIIKYIQNYNRSMHD